MEGIVIRAWQREFTIIMVATQTFDGNSSYTWSRTPCTLFSVVQRPCKQESHRSIKPGASPTLARCFVSEFLKANTWLQ